MILFYFFFQALTLFSSILVLFLPSYLYGVELFEIKARMKDYQIVNKSTKRPKLQSFIHFAMTSSQPETDLLNNSFHTAHVTYYTSARVSDSYLFIQHPLVIQSQLLIAQIILCLHCTECKYCLLGKGSNHSLVFSAVLFFCKFVHPHY